MSQQWGGDARVFLSGVDPGPRGPQYVIIDQGKYPEAADHAREMQMGTSWRGDESFPAPNRPRSPSTATAPKAAAISP